MARIPNPQWLWQWMPNNVWGEGGQTLENNGLLLSCCWGSYWTVPRGTDRVGRCHRSQGAYYHAALRWPGARGPGHSPAGLPRLRSAEVWRRRLLCKRADLQRNQRHLNWSSVGTRPKCLRSVIPWQKAGYSNENDSEVELAGALPSSTPRSTHKQVVSHSSSFYSLWRFLKHYTLICQ